MDERLHDMRTGNETNSRSRRMLQTKHSTVQSTSVDHWTDNDATLHRCLWYPCIAGVTIVSVISRLYKIEEPRSVCWDEAHFGKMASCYINHTLFFDIHPPLGKLFIALGGIIVGYDGSFSFEKPGLIYPDSVPYALLRSFCALFGAALVPVSFCTVLELSRSYFAAILAACLIIFDTAMLTLSQYILLDPFLLLFTALAVLCYVKFLAAVDRPFTCQWWWLLAMTGMFLGCSVSVKFIGLFVILLIGLSTVAELWSLLGDLSQSMTVFIKHLTARLLCLVVAPVSVYTILFYVHLSLLYVSGTADGMFCSTFQSQLLNNSLHMTSSPSSVAFGSVMTLKNSRIGGGYLHSHRHIYPGGGHTALQQVTSYGHKDDNNLWLIKPPTDVTADDVVSDMTMTSLQQVRSGDAVILEHMTTRATLHVRDSPALLTRRHLLVAAHRKRDDVDDMFHIVVTKSQSTRHVIPVTSVFMLVHNKSRCAISSHDRLLPAWGFEQMEVTCCPRRDSCGSNVLWNVEQVIDSRLESTSSTVHHEFSFVQKFIEFHTLMLRGNERLKPKLDEMMSLPWQWPINYRGQPFSGPGYRVYLLGNAVIWWACLAALTTFTVVSIIIAVVNKSRSLTNHSTTGRVRVMCACRWLLLGWGCHYVPFWWMRRVLYFHHYITAHYFAVMITAIVWQTVVDVVVSLIVDKSLQWCVWHVLVASTFGAVAYSFYLFHPLSYGMTDNSSSKYLHWLSSWDI